MTLAIVPSDEIREAVALPLDPRQAVHVRHDDLTALVAEVESLRAVVRLMEQRVEESEAYKQGRADGYAEAYRLFGPELESLRERASDFGSNQVPEK